MSAIFYFGGSSSTAPLTLSEGDLAGRPLTCSKRIGLEEGGVKRGRGPLISPWRWRDVFRVGVEKWVLLISGRRDKGREKVVREKRRGGGSSLWPSLTLLVTNGRRNEKGSPGIAASMDRQHCSSHCCLGFMAAGHPKSGSHKFDVVEVCRRLGNVCCYLLTVSVTDGLNKLPAAAVIDKAGLWIVHRQMLRPMTNLPS